MQEHFSNDNLSESECKQIITALESVLATDKFLAAPQMSAFLRYVVEQTVAGEQGRIKAFTVAVDALGKPESFDPQNDPVVRVLAGRLRATLDTYYEDNPDAPLIIKMKRGSYVPNFIPAQQLITTEACSAAAANPVDESYVSPDSKDHPPASTPSSSESIQPDDNDDTAMRVTPDLKASSSHFKLAGNAVEKQSNVTADKGPRTALTSLIAASVKTHPKLLFFCAILLSAVLISGLSGILGQKLEPGTLSTSAFTSTGMDTALRARPEKISVFISAMNQGSTLENNLKTVLSGAISENADISVHRILSDNQTTKYWPEDYILTIDAMELPAETRIELQLMEAETGSISHSRSLSLDVNANDRLSQQELSLIIDAARQLVLEEGPLFMDYYDKLKLAM